MGLIVFFIFCAALATAPAAVARSRDHGFWGWFGAMFFVLSLSFLAHAVVGVLVLVLSTVGTLSLKKPDAQAVPYFGAAPPPVAPAVSKKPPPQVQRLAQPPRPAKRARSKTKHQVCTSCDSLIGQGQWAYCPLCGSRDLAFK